MKKKIRNTLIAFLLLVCGIAFTAAASADTPLFLLPESLTGYARRLTDDDPDSRCTFQKGEVFTVSGLKGTAALLIEWYDLPDSVQCIQYDAGGNILSEQLIEPLYETMFVPDQNAESIGFVSDKGFSVSECRILSEEEKNAYVPLKIPEKTDLMLIMAHNADETRYLPGLTVYYAQKGLSVIPVYISSQSRKAIRETIEVCRASGIENQPVFLGFKYIHVDERFKKARTKVWREENVRKALVGAIRKYKPEVIVTHAQPGEDADCVNQYASELVVNAVKLAATGKEADSQKLYGSWEVKKLYLHTLQEEGLFNEDGSLKEGYCAIDTSSLKDGIGMTGCAYAGELIQKYHTLDTFRIRIDEQKLYFKLESATVDPDTEKNDLFEHIPVENAEAKAIETAEKTEVAQAESEDPSSAFFLDRADDGEQILSDADAGHWSYKNNALSIEIDRHEETKENGSPLVYYIAHIRMRDYDSYRSGFGYYLENGSAKSDPWVIARRYKAVLAITGDNLVNNEQSKKGTLIRNGQLYSAGRGKETTMAFMKDLTMKIYDKTTDAQVIVDDGVQHSYGFGPVLVENGIADMTLQNHRLNKQNPRCGIGMIEAGHYVAIVADGRQPGYSVGLTLVEFADMFVREGCSVAYNMDGGISAGMVFMGEHINRHLSSGSNSSSQRPWPDALLFGYSTQVPDESDPIINNGNYLESKSKAEKAAEKAAENGR